MTKTQLIGMLQGALNSAKCGDDEMLDRELIELSEYLGDLTETRLWKEAAKVPGGYRYSGICSDQLCFRLKDGGELRFIFCEADDADGTPSDMRLHIDHYGGELPPGITGPVSETGEK